MQARSLLRAGVDFRDVLDVESGHRTKLRLAPTPTQGAGTVLSLSKYPLHLSQCLAWRRVHNMVVSVCVCLRVCLRKI